MKKFGTNKYLKITIMFSLYLTFFYMMAVKFS